MAYFHNVHFGTSSGGGTFLRLGPTEESGAYFFGQFAVREYTGGYRVQGTQVPYADGLKDTGDGALDAGTATVEGWVHDTNAYSAEGAAETILGYFFGKVDFFVWNYYMGANSGVQKCRRLQSYRIGETEGWGGQRWDVSLTFAVYDPEF